ncbi:MAG: helix-turn-helix transcriptional regulator [Bacteroidota bacterium]
MRDEGKRLKSIRKSLALTQAVFAEGLGLKQGPYSMIESGKVGLSSEVLRKLINTYRINPVFLFEGQGSMMMEAEVAEEEDLTKKIRPIPAVEKATDSISLSRLADLRRHYPAADTVAKKRDH